MTPRPGELGWAILGTGKIARIFAASLARSRTGRLVGIASRSADAAYRFGEDFGVRRRYVGYDAALTDPDVDVVYLATPHTTHADLTIRAAAYGKHVLCEKPLTVTEDQAHRVLAAVRAHRVFLMEAFAYRCHPQTRLLVRLLREGAIGQVRMVQASFGYNAGPAPGNYLFRPDLAGGSILDVGCYTMSMCRLIAGAAQERDVADPVAVTGTGHLDHGVDLRAAAVVRFADGLTAQLSCAIDADLGEHLRVVGSDGTITLTGPFLPGRRPAGVLRLRTSSAEQTWPLTPGDPDLYALEADEVARHLPDGQSPAMSHADSLGNTAALDAWRRAIGLTFPVERASGLPGRGR